MKQTKRFLGLITAALLATSAWAQTQPVDVTSQYLTNADFEGDYSSYYKVNSTRHIYQPKGWTVDYKNESSNNMTILESTDKQASNFTGTYAIPEGEKRYMVRFRDNKQSEYIDLSQTITIQETGMYTFSAKMIREDGSKVNVELYANSNTVSNSNPGTWETCSFTIPLFANEEIKVGLRFTNKGAGGHKLGADDVKITYAPINEPELGRKDDFDGQIVDLADFNVDENDYTLEVQGTVGTEISIAAENVKYIPASDGKVRFVKHDGMMYVYEGGRYMTAVMSNKAPYTYSNALTTDDPITNNLLENPSFETVGDKLPDEDNKYKFGTPWETNVTATNIRIDKGDKAKHGKHVLVWRGSGNNNYFSQSLSNLRSFKGYKAYVSQVDRGNANAQFNIGIGDDAGKYNICSKTIKLGKEIENNIYELELGSIGNISNGYFTFRNTSKNTSSYGSDPVTQIDWIGLVGSDNFKISGVTSAEVYYGTAYAPIDLGKDREALAQAKAEAQALLDNDEYNGVVGTERTTLNDLIEKDPETETSEAYEEATENLNEAIESFKAAKAIYAALADEIAIAKALGVDEATADNYAATAEDTKESVITKTNNLKVAEYTYITENYTVDKEVTGYKVNQFEDVNVGASDYQGYNTNSGRYRNKWHPGALDLGLSKEVTLPKGDYAISVIARGQVGVGGTLYYKIGDATTSVNLVMKNGEGRGVDKEGKANFAEGGEYTNDNKGFGWEYRFITFSLDTETTVEIGVQASINNTWLSVYEPQLFTTELSYAKDNLQQSITEAQNALGAYPVGEEAFQVSEKSDLYVALKSAIATARNVLANATTADALTQAIEPLNTAVDNYTNGYVLNKPKADEAFNIVLVYAGWDYNGKAMTYIANDREDHGLYNIKYKAEPNANYAQAFTFTAVEGKINHYTLSMTDVDGNERYVCTGKVYDGNDNQIRTTTEAEKALAVKVIATSTEGIWNLHNTAANNYIGSQDEGVFTVNSHINFNLVKAKQAEVTLNISDARWATLILPFNATLPEGVKAYSCEGVAEDGVTLALEEAENIVANTPYLVSGANGTYDFSGYGLADKDSYTDVLFTGTYAKIDAPVGSYVLQKNNDLVGFYLVGDVKPTVKAYRCYMNPDAAGAPMFRIGEDETTSIHNSEFSTQDSAVVYDLMGRKVNTLEKGGMYIVNGKKVIVK